MEQDLMKPRVKIIAPFPGMEFYYNMKVGDILTDPGGYKAVTNQNGDAIRAFDYSTFPNIFQLLPWYAEREAGMMPEYVKSENGPEVYKIARWDIENMIGYVTENGICSLRTWSPGFGYEPATLTQYTQYIKNLKK